MKGLNHAATRGSPATTANFGSMCTANSASATAINRGCDDGNIPINSVS